jgi:hypothetical protein
LFQRSHIGRIYAVVQIGRKLSFIQSQVTGKVNKPLARRRFVEARPFTLVFIQFIVVLPESALGTGRFRGFGRLLRVIMNLI